MNLLSSRLTIATLYILALGIFTSVSFSALSHVLITIPGIYFFFLFLKNRDFQLPNSFWSVVAIVLSIVLSITFNFSDLEKPLKNLFKFKYFILPALSLFAFYYSKDVILRNKNRLLYLFITASTIASISGLIGLQTGFNPLKYKAACHATRACGLYGMYMTYGYGISLFQILLTGIILRRKEYFPEGNKYFLYMAWLVNFAGLFLSYTRGGWIALIVAVPFFFFKNNKKLFIGLFGSLLLLAVSVFTISPMVRDTIMNRQKSNDQRIAFYQTAFKAFQDNPIFGVGYRNFEAKSIQIKQKYNIAYPERGGHAHNNFMEHLASTGAFGALAFLAFCLLWGIETYKYSFLGFPFFVGFFSSGLFQYTFGDGENMFLIMTVWALTCLETIKGKEV